ncbi:unnamed protein product [Lymnaea stagnalis]|uniref:Secreted protein n=1 Tax=Lymnaea stagnalis TaxID=6523 RepID=A0AAV2I5P1_LYMST
MSHCSNMSNLFKSCALPQIRLLLVLQAVSLISCMSMGMLDTPDYDDQSLVEKDPMSLSEDCYRCVTYGEPEECNRCFYEKYPIHPFQMLKRSNNVHRSSGNSGCGCCVHSRNSNNFCCDMCHNAQRRGR